MIMLTFLTLPPLQNINHIDSVSQFVKLPSCLTRGGKKKLVKDQISLRLLNPKNLAPANLAIP